MQILGHSVLRRLGFMWRSRVCAVITVLWAAHWTCTGCLRGQCDGLCPQTWRYLDMALWMACMDFKGSSSIMSWACYTNCGGLTVSERGLYFLHLATLSSLPDASNSQRTLWTSDWVTLKICDISRSLFFACIAMITVCLFISWVSLLSSLWSERKI